MSAIWTRLTPEPPREGGLGQATVLAPDLERAGAVDQPVGNGGGHEFVCAGLDAPAGGERCLEVGEIVLGGAQPVVFGAGDGDGVWHGLSLGRHGRGS